MRFHNNPPSLGRPQHRNRGVSHHSRIDSRGVEHLFINFFISCDANSTDSLADLSLAERAESWLREASESLESLSVNSIQVAASRRWNDTKDYLTHLFHLLTNQAVSPPRKPDPQIPAQTEVEAARPWDGWGIAGLFGGLRSKSLTSNRPEAAEGAIWNEGEVHADLVRQSNGKFTWRYILVDIPSKSDIFC